MGSARINAEEGKTSEKSGKKKRDRGIEGETPNPIPAIDALIGDEEQNGKRKITNKKKQGEGPQPRYPGPFSRLLRLAGDIYIY